MSVACDFCQKLAERHDEVIFIAAPSGLAHICDECARDCVASAEATRAKKRIESLRGKAYRRGTAHRANPQQKGTAMTKTHNDTENHGNQTTVHNPKAPGQIEKVDPQTGDTTTENTNIEKPADR